MMAVDCQSGEVIWKTPNPAAQKMTHSSIVPINFGLRRMYVYCGSGGIVGVSAEDGKVLWEHTDWKVRTNVPTPVIVGEDKIFISAGYNKGSMMLRLEEEDGTIGFDELYRLKADVFGAEQQSPVFYNGYIYGVRPDGQLVCLNLEGGVVWNSTSAEKFGLGPYVIADGLIYVMDNNGVLTMAEAGPREYKKLGRAKILEGPDSWGPMAVASGRLILRDLNKMICLDIAER